MTGRYPDAMVDRAGRIKHINFCIGMALKEKLLEDKAKRLEHQIKIKEEDK